MVMGTQEIILLYQENEQIDLYINPQDIMQF